VLRTWTWARWRRARARPRRRSHRALSASSCDRSLQKRGGQHETVTSLLHNAARRPAARALAPRFAPKAAPAVALRSRGGHVEAVRFSPRTLPAQTGRKEAPRARHRGGSADARFSVVTATSPDLGGRSTVSRCPLSQCVDRVRARGRTRRRSLRARLGSADRRSRRAAAHVRSAHTAPVPARPAAARVTRSSTSQPRMLPAGSRRAAPCASSTAS
jgi:hypothetical protein